MIVRKYFFGLRQHWTQESSAKMRRRVGKEQQQKQHFFKTQKKILHIARLVPFVRQFFPQPRRSIQLFVSCVARGGSIQAT